MPVTVKSRNPTTVKYEGYCMASFVDKYLQTQTNYLSKKKYSTVEGEQFFFEKSLFKLL